MFAYINPFIFDSYYLHPHDILMSTKGAKSSRRWGGVDLQPQPVNTAVNVTRNLYADVRLLCIKTTLRTKYLCYARKKARHRRKDILLTALTPAARH